jgi:hypothetical protein
MSRWGQNIAPEMLHVSMGGRFQGSCLEAYVSICFRQGPAARAWKPVPGCLEASDAFTTYHRNNIGLWSGIFLLWVSGRFWV